MKPDFLKRCRKFTTEQMQMLNRTGRGQQMRFTGKEQLSGSLTLSVMPDSAFHAPEISEPGASDPKDPAPDTQALTLQTACGMMQLSGSGATSLLNRFSQAPFVVTPVSPSPGPAQTWFSELYNQHLYPDFHQLFGSLHHCPSAEPVCGINFELRWEQAGHTGHCYLRLPPATLEQLLTRQRWRPVSRLDVSSLLLSRRLTLGTVTLPGADYNRLGTGDILLLTTPYFSVQGEGALHIAGSQIQLSVQQHGTVTTCEVTHISKAASGERNMYDEYDDSDYEENNYEDSNFEDKSFEDDDFFSGDFDEAGEFDSSENFVSTEEPTTTDGFEHQPPLPQTDQQHHDQHRKGTAHFSAAPVPEHMPVTLSLQAGQIDLTIEALSQLTPGSILTATGEPAGHATLYHGHQPVARGELVDVDGRLGVQLTSVLLPVSSGQTEQAG